MKFRIVILSTILLAVASCASRPTSPVEPRSSVVSSVPGDGAAGVRLDSPITVDFGAAVDRATVESGMHLVAESDMFAGCPDPGMGDHGTMESVMDDPAMLRHMSDRHAVAGRHSWNEVGSACTFMPDSLMNPNTRYMLHLNEGVMDMLSRSGIGMGAGIMKPSGDMIMHFRTTSEDDHAGHHP